ncbi:hypothetical protein A5634_13120 [Mycobacterium asiaticum]|uniref:SnoaL-like domain-containing protein n=1 Tax=Mycobacterium asiaticum TaxID=1790 RepID=A0A1A3PBD0_MYCAS|nr:nuclear transport factor 2 family protein [Mycobacterium asiaticum]OBK31533.1 hypothetical protein A5634_13120 [Mycobacterium asiaticum]
MVDRVALSDLVHRYAAWVDDREFDLVATLFTESAELVVPHPPTSLEPVDTHRGHQAIAAAVAAVAQVVRTQHAIVGEVYDAVDSGQPGAARGRIACIAHHFSEHPDTGFTDHVWHLRYDDEYELTDAGWRIGRRTLTIDAIETRPVRLLRLRNPPSA